MEDSSSDEEEEMKKGKAFNFENLENLQIAKPTRFRTRTRYAKQQP